MLTINEAAEYLRNACGARAKFSEESIRELAAKANQKLPDGMWLRGGTYYARFRKNGKLIRKRLSRDFEVACRALMAMHSKADTESLGEIGDREPVTVLVADYADRKYMVLVAFDPLTGSRRTISSGCEDRKTAELVAMQWEQILNGDPSLVIMREQQFKRAIARKKLESKIALKVASSHLRLQKLTKELGVA